MDGNVFQRLRRAIAVVACVGGLAVVYNFFHMLFSWQLPSLAPVVDDGTTAADLAKEFHLLPNWDWPPPDGDGPTFDLFSPLTVELRNRRPVKWLGSSLTTTHYRLVRLEELPYPFQLDGFAEETDGTMRLFLRDARTGSMLALRRGESVEEDGPTVLSWEWESGGRGLRVILKEEEEHCLCMGVRAMSGHYLVEIWAETNGSATLHQLSAVGQSFPVPGGVCVLKAINPERSSVILQPPSGEALELALAIEAASEAIGEAMDWTDHGPTDGNVPPN
ncbi:MAG: hypothetical protein LBP65_02900 [Puniceicoccales bacterium]|jgi:hypothetical protein|nr:hypothetical protein [Puniceicoccales bacterium]